MGLAVALLDLGACHVRALPDSAPTSTRWKGLAPLECTTLGQGWLTITEDTVANEQTDDMQKDCRCEIPGLAPQTLFHFTNRKGLLGILQSNFRIAYSRERVVHRNGHVEFAAPMVSFCDLRLSELRAHMRSYGRYGIGMKKAWATRKGVNPVYYVSSQATLAGDYLDAVRELWKLREHLHPKAPDSPFIADGQQAAPALPAAFDMDETHSKLMDLHRYLKNYEGPLYRRGKLENENYRFADEREWRFVPPWNAAWPLVPAESMNDTDKKAYLNGECARMPLHFEPNDINYIVVEFEHERDEIIQHINASKEPKYEPSDITRLASRIVSAEQIANDV